MNFTENKLILIADAHLNDSETDEAFFRMLDRIRALPSSYPVVFLGDIYDLWFALPWYESESQKRFLQWCKEEKQKRNAGKGHIISSVYMRIGKFSKRQRPTGRCLLSMKN